MRTLPRNHYGRTLVENPPPTPLTTPCRLWQGPLNSKGYGVHPSNTLIHRWVIEQVGEDQHGTPWNPSLHVMHLCDHRLCFRYDHLQLGTLQDNVADMVAKGRQARGETSGRSKLTRLDVCLIRYLLSRGWTQNTVAERYGISQRQVSAISTRENWGHIPRVKKRRRPTR